LLLSVVALMSCLLMQGKLFVTLGKMFRMGSLRASQAFLGKKWLI
jgi:hypothetical protein